MNLRTVLFVIYYATLRLDVGNTVKNRMTTVPTHIETYGGRVVSSRLTLQVRLVL